MFLPLQTLLWSWNKPKQNLKLCSLNELRALKLFYFYFLAVLFLLNMCCNNYSMFIHFVVLYVYSKWVKIILVCQRFNSKKVKQKIILSVIESAWWIIYFHMLRFNTCYRDFKFVQLASFLRVDAEPKIIQSDYISSLINKSFLIPQDIFCFLSGLKKMESDFAYYSFNTDFDRIVVI